MRKVLITGANRGLGLEMARQCLEQGDRGFAACRNPQDAAELLELQRHHGDGLTLVEVELADDASIRQALETVGQHTDGLDLLLNNAGVMPLHETPETLDGATLDETFHINCTAPMLVVREALPLLRRGTQPKVLNISSSLGSLTNKTTGGLYAYCASKAALNMLSRTLAHDLHRHGITVVAIHPGWVQTDMGGPRAPLEAPEAVRGILQVAATVSLQQSGQFLTWEGEEHPW
ncbi:MAG: SDR family oxidoreductase [Acidobacteriota bacterium]|nr:SDR family oxidoreductase [Acidobacteriota bacterium]